MKLRPDQQRVASLLKETITLMCRNGLIFDSQFCIEATIGVTLDDKDVFVVSLNEVIGKDERSDVESNGGDPLPGSPEKKPLAIKRGRPRKKTPKVTPKKAARKNKAEDSWGESADDFDDYASSDDASPPAKKSKDLLQEELNMTCDAGENVAVKQELQYDSSNVSRVPEEGEELLFSLEGQQSSELQLQQASNSMSESTSQVPSTSQQNDPGSRSGRNRTSSNKQSTGEGKQTYTRRRTSTAGSESGMNIVCQDCGQKFRSTTGLNDHRKLEHLGQPRYVCSECPRGFMSKTLWKAHEASHTNVKDFKCEVCDKEFRYKTAMRDHMIMKHDAPGSLACKCGKKYAKLYELKRHTKGCKALTGSVPYSCPICSAGFTYKHNLTRHMLSAHQM